ncbi:unnamed protein product, partial [Anisakis simplex]|uniref:Peptidase A1 domain-containing protein n=1 Tax=Anisakis simplex TaxID=6269 RepID=A0A0M3JFB7_ANISI
MINVFRASDETCESKQKFNSTGSRTYRAAAGTWAIQYRRGFAAGLYGRDNVRFAPIGYYQLEIENIWFGRATMVSDAFKGLEMDGILGLGFWSTATGRIMPPMGNAWRQHLLDEP